MREMIRLLVMVASVLLVGTSADAAPKKKYHFQLTAVTAKGEVKADVAKVATPRVESQVKKAFESHEQLVAKLDGAPELPLKPTPQQMDAYRAFLKKKGLAGAYWVTVEVTDASEELVPTDKPNTQRLVVRVAVHVLGEQIPGKTMGFTGDGQATIKQEVGKKVRDKDKEFAWDSAAEVAIADAMTTVFKQLAIPPPDQKKK
jgi:hypothetical protein